MAIPETLGPYRVLERLGKGMSGPFLAVHEPTQAQVVLRVIPHQTEQEVSSWAHCRAEAPSAMTIDHPCIARIYALEQDGDVHFLVVEHVPGANLQEIVRRDGPLSVAGACDGIRRAAMALDYMHQLDWTHRDIRPESFIAAKTQETPAGLAVTMLNPRLGRPWFYDDSELPVPFRYDEMILGTVDYLSPDCAIDAEHADIRADIYSLGCVFYFLLTGGPPFPEGSVAQKLLWHQTRTPKRISEFRADVPANVILIVDRMMAKDQRRRFQTPAEIIDSLDSLPDLAPQPPPRTTWPSAVVELAQSFKTGQDCGFALHDALVEAGELKLAEHFRGPWPHPKECWAIRRILRPEWPRRRPRTPPSPLDWLRGLLGRGYSTGSSDS